MEIVITNTPVPVFVPKLLMKFIVVFKPYSHDQIFFT